MAVDLADEFIDGVAYTVKLALNIASWACAIAALLAFLLIKSICKLVAGGIAARGANRKPGANRQRDGEAPAPPTEPLTEACIQLHESRL
jgi:hypothetical protein